CDTRLIVDEQNFLPRLTAIPGAIHTAIGSPAERIALASYVDDVGVFRMDLDLTNLSDLFQSGELPRPAGVGRFVDASPQNHIGPNGFASGADIHDVRIGVRHINRANRTGGDLTIGHGQPRDAEVFCLPHTTAARTRVEYARLCADTGDRSRAA